MCRDDRRNHPVAPNHSTGSARIINGLGALCECGLQTCCDITSVAAWACENTVTRGVLYNSRQPSKGREWLAWVKATVPTCPLVYPEAFARHPTEHPFNSPRSEFHDKC
jgi:hypothetical protein